jgi:hypothetical protein
MIVMKRKSSKTNETELASEDTLDLSARAVERSNRTGLPLRTSLRAGDNNGGNGGGHGGEGSCDLN